MKSTAVLLSVLLISGLFINSGYGQSPNPTLPESGIIQVGSVYYHREVTQEYEFDSAPEDVLKSTSFEERYNAEDVRECRTVSQYDVMQTKMERLRIDLYETTEVWTFWDYVGVGAIIVGVVALTVVTAGAAGVGIAAGITAIGAGAVVAGAGAAITGGTAMIITNTGYEKTTNLKSTEFMDVPLEAPRVVNTKEIKTDWADCSRTVVR